MGKYISIRSGATALPEQSVAHLTHDIIYQNGVLDLDGNHWKVTEHNPQNMSVDIAVGRGYFKKTVITYHGYTDSVENPAIAANNSGNPRIDAVVVYVDLAVSANTDASNVLKFLVVQGSPNASPIAPTDGEIQTAVGSGNPFIRLANVTVANGASSITNANIADTRVPAYTKFPAGIYDTNLIKPKVSGSYQNAITDTDGATITLDMAKANVHDITLGGNRTLAVTNITTNQYFQVDLIQDATGGRSVTWWSGIKWPDNIPPVLTPTANKRDSFLFRYLGSNQYAGYTVGQNL